MFGLCLTAGMAKKPRAGNIIQSNVIQATPVSWVMQVFRYTYMHLCNCTVILEVELLLCVICWLDKLFGLKRKKLFFYLQNKNIII